ncbi:MAG: polyhydroxyalkanoate synthesis regulator DNA-binding domain-containing protein [Myxococcota bacterium]
MSGPRKSEVTVKKYSNRRLYDTSDSRYITLDELAQKIRGGAVVKVVDAKTGDDLTQATLAQIILESRRAARLLPVPLLIQLIRMGDDALSEFFSHYMSWALELYLQARSGAKAMAPFNPFATLPFSGASAFARMFSEAPWADGRADPSRLFEMMMRRTHKPNGMAEDGLTDAPLDGDNHETETASEEEEGHPASDLADLRREIEELKAALKSK